MSEQKLPYLNNWWLAPVKDGYVLFGHVTGHPKLGDSNGRLIRTSLVQRIDFPGQEAITLNTVYRLGDMDPYSGEARHV